MKKFIIASLMVALGIEAMALGRAKVREYARFLSDRMAYELHLTSMQYDDCYEINYDCVDAVGDLLDDMERGSSYATDRYYDYLDYRNEDLSYVLTSYQYSRFIDTECFYRPFCIYEGEWAFRPYMVYSNRSVFYMGLPSGFNIYIGAHSRRHFSVGFYVGRYHHPSHVVYAPIRHHHDFDNFHRHDFGPIRSGHGAPPRHSVRPQPPQHRPSPPQTRPERPQNRPSAPQTRPERPQNRPSAPQTRPERPQNRPSAPQTRPERPQNKPGNSQSRPSKPNDSPSRGGGGGVSRHGRG
ncbi:MAG: hypothetical protein ACI4TR_03780 [Bacteroidaceae bacterium]